VIYLFVGLGTTGDVAQNPAVQNLLEGIRANFNVTGFNIPLLLLPAIITVGAAILKKPVIPGMILSCIIAWILAILLQPGTEGRNIPYPNAADFDFETMGPFLAFRANLIFGTWDYLYPAYAMVRGYVLTTEYPALNSLLSQGGMMSMMDTMLLALAAFAFAGIMSATKMLEVLLQEMVKFARTTGTLIATTAASCVLTALMTGSSYLSILLPGELFRKTYFQRGLAAKNLSRTTEDCGTVVVPLIPWSAAGVYMAGVLKVDVLSYAPLAFFCYLGVFVAVIYGFTGFAIAPRTREDETQPGS
jgi:NhaC family Na+:H+ antiporter